MTTAQFTPTAEQQEALAAFATGKSLKIEAGAGTGKTATLKLLAESAPERKIQYVAFNKAIVTEATAKFPANVKCNTAHSLAYKAIVVPEPRFRNRLKSFRMRSDQVARILGIDPYFIRFGEQTKVLQPGTLASYALATVTKFCQSADQVIEAKHVPYIEGIDLPTTDGKRTYAHNDEVRKILVPAARKAWADLSSPTGKLPFKHDHYLKLAHLKGIRIPADVILFDESQDANPVLVDIVAQQEARGVQVVWVGDSNQAIYEFTGAVNALASQTTDTTTFLSQSFRFGEVVAKVANEVLAELGAELRLVGLGSIPSVLDTVDDPDVVLCRTNATAVDCLLAFKAQGEKVHLVGGGDEIVRFAKAAARLQDGLPTDHPELACFTSWAEVQSYVRQDAQGGDLRLLVSLVDKYGTDVIIEALENMIPEAKATRIVSTAHKGKGREWDSVQIAGDFPSGEEDDPLSPAELRLLYVAVTRAKRRLDITRVAALEHLLDEAVA